ncbi:NAD(P)H-quinone oxidoreductase [Nocardioides oleivorans]|uniref:NAD(P)H-quinone oxidoreductase n=1 Tax=Nocardioides oleivorans TaxID=273676 RepID=A0A4Q2RZ86_9ACTN|nr:NAD(P)H-quinone oxidoreductase [Nocardioides oleivorans]
MRYRTTLRSTTPPISTRTDPLRAVVTTADGGPEVLSIGEVDDPRPAAGEVLIDVAATAVNRADTLQRMGLYPPPPGASDIIGLECSGRIAELGDGVEGWKVGDEVCALLAGGGYAEKVAVPVGQVMPIPAGLSLVEAAALPEVATTVWSNVFMTAHLTKGERFLVHGGAGGIGTMAIQLASTLGAEVFTTAGSAEKLDLCLSLGATRAISYRDEDFVEVLEEAGGADVILDNMGAKYLPRNVSALATGGRLVIIGMQGGAKGELDINALLRKRASVTATSLRARPLAEKAAICCGVVENVWPLVAAGSVRPIVEATMPLAEVGRAHEAMEAGGHAGKFVLTL